ncbi:unnamed protein product, partial [Ectocarpus sp. 12 AP-2014]
CVCHAAATGGERVQGVCWAKATRRETFYAYISKSTPPLAKQGRPAIVKGSSNSGDWSSKHVGSPPTTATPTEATTNSRGVTKSDARCYCANSSLCCACALGC